VAQIGQIFEVLIGKRPPEFHGRENGAKPFAIAAGVADGHHPISFL
jgi:hypothetical protein